MAIKQLEYLGWELLGKERQEDGQWCVLVGSCGICVSAGTVLLHVQYLVADALLMEIVPTSATCRGSSAPALTGISQLVGVRRQVI